MKTILSKHKDKNCGDSLETTVNKLATALSNFRKHVNETLEQVLLNQEKLDMKLSEVKTIINQSSGQTKEALGEIGTKIADLQKQIDDLIAGNGDPEITDEVFLTNLNQLKTDAAALAAIVPNPA